ncbi:MAG TPA: alpha/beta hydrolase [Dehalococcoidia bacterium]|nr:alpha/beta hydrolase [Dehalococcoidia bacterium]
MYGDGDPGNLGDELEAADMELSIIAVAGQPSEVEGTLRVLIQTTRGDIPGLLTPCEGEPGAVIMVGGAYGGFDGPADSVYERLAAPLAQRGVSTLRIHYRRPNDFEECVLDVLAAASFLKGIGAERIALVGHSFGGAVVVKAAQLSDRIVAIVSMSPQLFGTRQVHLMSKPLLLIHGADDQVLDMAASQDIYDRANEPKELVILPDTGHTLYQGKDEVYELLLDWIPKHVRWAPSPN